MARQDDTAEKRARIEAARRQIGHLVEPDEAPRLRLGAGEIEACLKGGLKAGALHEVAAADHRALPAAQGFLLALARMAAGLRVIAWVQERRGGEFGVPYAPGLKHFGLDPARLLFIRCKSREEALWAMEESLRIGGIGAVVGMRTAKLDEIVRQKDPALKSAVELLATGQVSAALDALHQQGRVKEIANAEERIRAIAKSYVESPDPHPSTSGEA